ncbi:hypothetical protein GURASL_19070 [Geotalea uraniireducens]|uniref:Uncharacterized protein n=1 Tax=Geotalea uraniireducens TaxID=351604 RepID=A0ABM8EKX9_9BACT|nr:hypothetical protein [Geotalea uraniireducens]BDV42984.1 hypothetical protein GURASL_19070 [Geotalea uraniireducens]
MKFFPATFHGRLRVAATAILAAGLTASTIAYLLAAPPADLPLDYDPRYSKSYQHDLELYGGTLNVLASEFMDWFAGLWHGRALAGTVAVFAVTISAILYFVANRLQRDAAVEDSGPAWERDNAGPRR